LPIGTVSANVSASFSRLAGMARAWAMPGTSLTGDSGLLAAVITGLDFMNAKAYTSGRATYDNWWDWQIGSPQILEGVMCLVFDHLTAGQVANYLAAVNHYVPESRVATYSGTSTGANRVDLCQVIALSGILGKNSAKVGVARNALSPVFPYVTDGDGLYVDGSFVQHSVIPYTGTYGAVLIGGLARLFALLAASSWAVTDPNRQIIFDAVEKAYAPFLFNGLVMDGVSGRGISRGISASDPLAIQHDDHRRGHPIVDSVLLLAAAASATERARWRGLAKGWYQRDYWSPVLSDRSLSVPALARAKSLLDDAAVAAIAEPTHSRIFGGMDRAVHRRPGWALAISMCSTRTSFYEHGNGENVRGWHTSNGMTYYWGNTWGNGQYSDAFWPTVDPYRLPGTTVSRKPLPNAAGPAWGGLMPANNWASGASDGEFSVVGQYCQGAQSTLLSKKSWICLDDAVICLGAGISSTDGYAVESTVDNRNLGPGTGSQAFVVNGTAQPVTMGWTATLTGVGWAHLGGFAGYVFPGGATVKAVRHERTGRWSDINSGGSATSLSRKYLTLWYDHGVDPANGGYAYLLMPGATAAATQARAADTGFVSILVNTRYQQGVSIPSRGVTAINFWEIPSTSIGAVNVDQPCAVLIRQSGNAATICLSDPRQNIAAVMLTWERPVSAVVSKDSTVTVVQTGAQLRLRFDTGGAAGGTHKATVTLG
ncbi:MAG TPA: polysaccharide lyase 8 family protein, partial [Candidatus Limnocylindrales bacterium]